MYYILMTFAGMLMILAPLLITLLMIKPELVNKWTKNDYTRLKIGARATGITLLLFMFSIVFGAALEPSSVKADREKREQAAAKQEIAEKCKTSTTTETVEESIAYSKNRKDDASLKKGEERVEVKGVEGKREKTYEITMNPCGGDERTLVSNEVVEKPVAQVILVGTYDASSEPTPAPQSFYATPPAQTPPQTSAYYKNCTAARAAGAAPVYVGEPGYGTHLDRDGDGVGCE